jgi:hypothetical protein
MIAAHQSILMCPPHHYGVDYVINSWMQGQIGRTDRLGKPSERSSGQGLFKNVRSNSGPFLVESARFRK